LSGGPIYIVTDSNDITSQGNAGTLELDFLE